jgi:hypothetical protein
MTTAFVPSASGSLGAVPVDVLLALAAQDAVAGRARRDRTARIALGDVIDAVRDRSRTPTLQENCHDN